MITYKIRNIDARSDDVISIVVPAYNEENGIKKTVERVKKVNFDEKSEIIVVDDGSSDKTYLTAKKIKGIVVVKHDINKGKAAALNTGFQKARGDVVATIDADCTYPPESLPEMLQIIRSGKADVVIGSRFLHRKRGIYLILGVIQNIILSVLGTKSKDHTNFYGNALFSSMISLLTTKKITDGSTGLRIFDKNILKNLNIKSKGLDWEVEMTTRALRAGFRVREVPISYYPRVGKTKLKPLKDGVKFFLGIVKGRFF